MTDVLRLDPALSRSKAQRRLIEMLNAAGINAPATDARMILCAALGIDHAAMIRDPDSPIGAAADRIDRLARRRILREPMSRILGRREFWGLDFAVSPAVLDPRPETETLVEATLPAVAEKHATPLRILDLGVGSGAILAALLTQMPKTFGVGVDVSEA